MLQQCSLSITLWVALLLGTSYFAAKASPLEEAYPMRRDTGLPFPTLKSRQDNHETFRPQEDYEYMLSALDTMQHQYFNGCTWPAAIDWTASVMETYISSVLITLSSSSSYQVPSNGVNGLFSSDKNQEQLIETYFNQVVNFYYAQHAQSLTAQANDDMLWTVLGWLEAVKFIKVHSALHYSSGSSSFYGEQYVADFAHRARLFYDLASQGYDNVLCGGGIDWNPHLTPYKNTITNSLYVAASVGMYLYFPGDSNPSPSFIVNSSSPCLDPTADFIVGGSNATAPLPSVPARNPAYLQNAIKTYNWLLGINMTESYNDGLFADGYHLSTYNATTMTSTTDKCDQRDEMLYTYNQGVLLSGIRGLWEATNNATYLEYGHSLIQSMITATGFYNGSCAALGCTGIMADTCDSSGTCSQDAQTFKGTYFHHFMLFCAPLAGDTVGQHSELCSSYLPWLERNAAGAFSTRNDTGDYGMWWGPFETNATVGNPWPQPPYGSTDYRNDVELLTGRIWGWNGTSIDGGGMALVQPGYHQHRGNDTDVNDRGLGRTVETQGGAVAVFDALYAVVKGTSGY